MVAPWHPTRHVSSCCSPMLECDLQPPQIPPTVNGLPFEKTTVPPAGVYGTYPAFCRAIGGSRPTYDQGRLKTKPNA